MVSCDPLLPSTVEGWQPKLVALDIDGTLLKWVEGTGQDYEVIAPELYDAVQAAVDARRARRARPADGRRTA